MTNHLIISIMIVTLACSKKSDDENAETQNTSTLALELQNPLLKAYPLDLQITSPTLATGDKVKNVNNLQIELVDNEETYVEKVEESKRTITATDTADCVPVLDFTPQQSPSCYAQTVTKDGVGNTKTSQLIKFGAINEQKIGSETSDPSAKRILDDAVGILAQKEGTVPCSAKVAEYIIAQSSQTVSRTQNVLAGMLCAAKVKDKASALPEKGKTLDLLAEVKEVWGSSFDIKKAEISRIADDYNSQAVYRSVVSLIRKDSNGDETKLIVDMLTISSATAGDYSGRAFLYDQRRNNGVTSPTAISLNFNKTSNDLNVVLREASFNFDVKPKDITSSSNGELSYTKIAELDNNTASPSLLQVNINTEDGTGVIAQMSAPALQGEEVANVVIASTSVKDSTITGCAIHGNTKAFMNNSNQLNSKSVTILGKHCLKNQILESGTNYGNTLEDTAWADFANVQMQCFSKNSSEYTISANNLNYTVGEKCGVGVDEYKDHVTLVSVEEALGKVKVPELPADITIAVKDIDYKLDL